MKWVFCLFCYGDQCNRWLNTEQDVYETNTECNKASVFMKATVRSNDIH